MDILSSIFPSISHVALTATATTSTKELIIDSLRLDNAFLVEANPDRSNIFYESKLRPSSGEDKLDAVLAPLADELMEKKNGKGKRKNPVDDVMRTFTTAQSCKKKTLFLITLDILHSCCDFHKLNCNCESCIDNTIVEEMGECSIEPPAKGISANSLSTCLCL